MTGMSDGKAKIERETVGGEPVVRVTFGHWSAACIFLMIWLAFWSFGCYMLAVELVTKPFSFKLALFSAGIGAPAVIATSFAALQSV